MRRSETAVALAFTAPSLIGFAVFYLAPFAMGVYTSFTDRTQGGRFVGLQTYRELLASSSFRKAASNTLLFTGIGVPLVLLLSLALALALNRRLPLRAFLRSAYVLPLVVPVASVVAVWQIVFDWNGTMNLILHRWGLARVDWLQSEWAMGIVAAIYGWKNIGYDMILFLAGLQSIPQSYYETAKIEGAGRLRQFWHITWVYLTPTTFFVLLISTINSFKVFRETYLLAGDYPYDRIYLMQHLMNNLFFSLQIEKLTAAATLMVGCIVLLVLALQTIERRYRESME